MQIAMEYVTLEKDAMLVLGILPPQRMVDVFVTFADFTAEGEPRRTARAERHALDGIEPQHPARRVAQCRPVLVLAQSLERRSRGRRLLAPCRCSEQARGQHGGRGV